ncbi:hypothetical protein [Bradyrhizobium guangzhouense]|uniref:DUF1376 domain-containing protein n=1 Tax=Bradyrhizobium guangzhouense TaxID=1325095 RepID=A0AAE6C6A6_9BRAD|nr:hypothetical protein [Bradyrhizobium guangzhouense]QAU44187.1 hypothetical protein XH91_01655 [Bradyrhizobium guangzhouense]
MSERGVFAVDRGIWDHDVLADRKPFSRREAWLWLVSEAAWKPHKRRIIGRSIELARGQFAGSLRFIASKWRWNEPRVRRFLGALISAEMVDANTDAGVTVITICKYDEYQRVSLPSDATRESDADALTTQERRKVEDREDKESLSSLRSERMPAKRPARSRARAQLPDCWQPDDRDLEYVISRGFQGPKIREMTNAFSNHHRSKGSLMADWHAAWRTWVDNEIKFHGGTNGYRTRDSRTAQPSGSSSTSSDAILAGMGRLADRITARKLAERQEGTDFAGRDGGERH